MYQLPTTHDNPEYAFEYAAAAPPDYAWSDTWLQQSYQAESIAFSNRTSLDLTPHISQLTLFSPQFDGHIQQTEGGILPDVATTGLNLSTTFEEFERFTNNNFYDTNQPEHFRVSVPPTFDLPIDFSPDSGPQTKTSESSSSDWAASETYSSELSSPYYSASPTTISPSDPFAPYIFSTNCRRSASSPPSRATLERHSSTPLSSVPKRETSPIRHTRTFSHGPRRRSRCDDFDDKSAMYTERIPNTCAVPGCGKAFVNLHDLGRHRKTVHVDKRTGEGYRCASCTRSDKIWTRVDNFKKHLRDQHGVVHVKEHVKKSTRTKRGVEARVEFAVTTPETFSQKMSSEGHDSTS